jgi:hypothetical protein
MKTIVCSCIIAIIFFINSCISVCDKRFASESMVDTGIVNMILDKPEINLNKLHLIPNEKLVENKIHLRSNEEYEGIDYWYLYKNDKRTNDNSFSTIEISIIKFNDNKKAIDWFEMEFKNRIQSYFIENVDVRGDTLKKYLLTKTMEAQADPEGLCSPMGYFYSYLIIKNKNDYIEIMERTSNKKSIRINEYLAIINAP